MDIEQNIFFDEFNNKLKILEDTIVEIKATNYQSGDINELFRAIHTIKGTADLLGLFSIVSLTHKAEDLLQFVREGKIKIDKEICDLLIELKKFIVILVEDISEGSFDNSDTEKLFNQFENSFNQQINKAQNIEYEQTDVKTILVVDDSAMVRYLVKKVGADEGYNVLTTDNTKDAYTKIQENAVDILFCDFNPPNQEFIEFIELVRTDVSYKNIPLVMLLSNNHQNDDIRKLAKQTHAKAWIGKPLDAKKLELVLSKIIIKK
jgi:chemotaxis protein histidine kinase CheA